MADDGGEVRMIRIRGVNAQRGAAQDDADYVRVSGRETVVGKDLAEGTGLADAASDQLGGLGSEVEDDDFLHDRAFCSGGQI